MPDDRQNVKKCKRAVTKPSKYSAQRKESLSQEEISTVWHMTDAFLKTHPAVVHAKCVQRLHRHALSPHVSFMTCTYAPSLAANNSFLLSVQWTSCVCAVGRCQLPVMWASRAHLLACSGAWMNDPCCCRRWWWTTLHVGSVWPCPQA